MSLSHSVIITMWFEKSQDSGVAVSPSNNHVVGGEITKTVMPPSPSVIITVSGMSLFHWQLGRGQSRKTAVSWTQLRAHAAVRTGRPVFKSFLVIFWSACAGVRHRRERLQQLCCHGGDWLPWEQNHRGQLQRKVRRCVRCPSLLALYRCHYRSYHRPTTRLYRSFLTAGNADSSTLHPRILASGGNRPPPPPVCIFVSLPVLECVFLCLSLF